MIKVIVISVVWLLIVNVFALFSLNRFNLKTDTAYNWIKPTDFSQSQTWDLVSLHSRWDSVWYLDIAENGYQYKGEGKLSNIVFFPLYPALMIVISLFTFGNLVLAGWIISSVSLVIACIFLYKLVLKFHSAIDPYQPIFFLLIFPTAFFFNTVYTESLFLALSLAAFYLGLKRNFLLAGIVGLAASLTRLSGILIFIPIIWEYYEAFGFRKFINSKILPLFLIPLGTLSFFLYHYLSFGDWLLLFKVESWWGRSFSFNKAHFELFSNSAIINFSLDLIFIILTFTAIILLFKKLRASYGLYVLSGLIFPLASGTFMSICRYILVLFPIYILIASIKSQFLKQIWILISILFLGMYITLFVNNYWAG